MTYFALLAYWQLNSNWKYGRFNVRIEVVFCRSQRGVQSGFMAFPFMKTKSPFCFTPPRFQHNNLVVIRSLTSQSSESSESDIITPT